MTPETNIIKMPLRHIQAECKRDSCNGGCHECCLAICDICRGYEGSLTTHCPGRPLTNDERDDVYENGHDFYNNEWIILDDKHPMAKNPRFQ